MGMVMSVVMCEADVAAKKAENCSKGRCFCVTT